MGASVGATVEYKMYGSYSLFAEISLPRDVEFLCAIAWGDGGDTSEMPFPPRGFPTDASYETKDLFFVTRDKLKEYFEHFEEDTETEAPFEDYARAHGDAAINEYKLSDRFPMPELTEYGWLTLAELEANINRREIEIITLHPITRAMLAAMNELATSYSRENVRLVFWVCL